MKAYPSIDIKISQVNKSLNKKSRYVLSLFRKMYINRKIMKSYCYRHLYKYFIFASTLTHVKA